MIDKDLLKQLVDLNNQVKELDKQMAPLKKQVKAQMLKDNSDLIEYEDTKFTLTHSERVTTNKDGLLMLIAKNKLGSAYLMQTIEPDIERLKAEIGTSISQEEFDAYVKITKVDTFKIK